MADPPDVTAHLLDCGPDLNAVIASRLHAALIDAQIAEISAALAADHRDEQRDG